MKKRRALSLVLALSMVMTLVSPTIVSATETAESRVETIIDSMTLEQKITQTFMMDFRTWGGSDFTVMNDDVYEIVKNYDFGGFIYFANNIKQTEQSYDLTMALQAAATEVDESKAVDGIAMLICADQEGGSVYRLGSGTALPGNMALGATGDTEYAYEAGKIIGSELSVLGINTNLAPVVDVNNNANNPVIGLRSYGDDATAVGEMASATIAGMAEYDVIGCAKHFPGHGDTATDSHYGLPVVDKSYAELLECELAPYAVAIDQGIEMIMTAHILYPQLDDSKLYSELTGQEESRPATLSKAIITDLLKGEMGFEGVVSTDGMNMAGIVSTYGEVQAAVEALAAGVDMLCMPATGITSVEQMSRIDAIIEAVKDAVETGYITEERLDDACRRILTLKESKGILDYDASEYSLETALATVGSDENRAAEREIAAAAATVVKNEYSTLPLDTTETSKVLLLCPYTNERSQMLWGVARAKEAGVVPEGAEVMVARFNSASLDVSVTAVDEDGASSTWVMKDLLDWCDSVIINSEISSTSSGRMSYGHWLSAAPNAFIDYIETNSAEKATVIMSVDKPYDVQLYPNADAVVAVYGCKGSSVDPTEALIGGATGDTAASGPNIVAGVEVILGTFDAQGTLPVNIPKYDSEAGAYTDEIVYERGYGLVYVDMTELAGLLDEAAGLNEEDYTEEDWETITDIIAAAEEVYAHGVQSVDEYEVIIALMEAVMEMGELPYTDVEETDWYYEYAKDVYQKGLMTGLNETTFGPAEILSRAQFAVILYRMEGEPEVTYSEKFPDVAEGQFYTDAVLWAAENGIVTGYDEGYFGPGDEITREQMATMMYRYAKYKELDVTATADISAYPDAASVSAFAQEAMKWCVAEEIITGDSGSLKPQGVTVRAVCATIVSRFTKI